MCTRTGSSNSVHDLAMGLIHTHEKLSGQQIACVSGFLIAVSKLHNGDILLHQIFRAYIERTFKDKTVVLLSLRS